MLITPAAFELEINKINKLAFPKTYLVVIVNMEHSTM